MCWSITASGKFVLSAAAASDGSETPDAILAETVDASAEDKQAVVYFSGEFNENALTLGTGQPTLQDRRDLRPAFCPDRRKGRVT